MRRFGWVLVSIVGLLLVVALALPQESPKVKQTPNSPGVEDIFEEHIATDGSSLFVTTIKGSEWVACKNIREYVPINAMKGREGWTDAVNLEEGRNRCVLADNGDLVYVQAASRDDVLRVSFRARSDVHQTLAWFINCAALPRVAEMVCSYAE